MKRIALIACLSSACTDPTGLALYDNTGALRAALAPNASLVTVGLDVTSENGVSTSHDLQGNAKVLELADGFVAAVAPNREGASFDATLATLGLVRGGSFGLRTLERGATRATFVRLGDEALVIVCGADGIGVPYLTDPEEGFVPLTGGILQCTGYLLGTTTADDQVVVVYQGMAARFVIDREQGTLSQENYEPELTSLPPLVSLVYVDEPVTGELALVSLADGTMTYQRSENTVAAEGITSLDGVVQVRRGSDGALRIATESGLWRWDADSGAAPTLLAETPAAPEGTNWRSFAAFGGAYAWTAVPNPQNPDELYPTGATVRVANDEGFSTFAPSPTPCCDASACREAAESYVIGGFSANGTRFAFYDLWTWVGTNEHAMVAAADPLACEP